MYHSRNRREGCEDLYTCAFLFTLVIPLLNVHHDTDNIRAIGQVPQRIWRITQIVNEHIEKTRQKAGEGSRREARRTKATSRGTNPYRGPETGQRPKEAAKDGQGRVETGSSSPTHTGKAGIEREDEGVNCIFCLEPLPSFTYVRRCVTWNGRGG